MNPSLFTPPKFLFLGVEQDQRKWRDISWARTWKSHWVTICRHRITCTILSRATPSMPVGWIWPCWSWRGLLIPWCPAPEPLPERDSAFGCSKRQSWAHVTVKHFLALCQHFKAIKYEAESSLDGLFQLENQCHEKRSRVEWGSLCSLLGDTVIKEWLQCGLRYLTGCSWCCELIALS